jgi:hypothetical protein
MSHTPGVCDPTLRLSLPEDGITDGDVVLRFTTEDQCTRLVSTTR